jgi:hypothetical protein
MKQADSSTILGFQRNNFFTGIVSLFMDFSSKGLFGHRRLTLEVQGTFSLTQPAGGVAGPTKNFSSSPNVFVGDPMFLEKNLDSRPEALRDDGL